MELPLQDKTADASQLHQYLAETRDGFRVALFDKAQPGAATVRLSQPGAHVELDFQLAGSISSRELHGAAATAHLGGLTAIWTSYSDRLKEDLVLASSPASDQIDFSVEEHGLTFTADGVGGYIARDQHGHPHFHLLAPTVTDAAGHSGTATLSMTDQAAAIHLDPAFLSAATYPLTVDPTTVYASGILADSPVAYWRLGESSGTTAFDATGNGHNGTIQGTLTMGVTGAIYGDSDTAYGFSPGGYIQVPNSSAIETTASFTLETWVKISSSTAGGMIIQRSDDTACGGTGCWGFEMSINGDQHIHLWTTVGCCTSTQVVSSTILQPNQWYYVAGQYTGTQQQIWINGAEDASVAQSGSLRTGPSYTYIAMGHWVNGWSQPFVGGSMDEVAIYGQPLTASQIEHHYQLGIDGEPTRSDSGAPTFASTFDPGYGNIDLGDPVQSRSGTYTYNHTDFAIAGRGPSPSFSRTYHTNDGRTMALGPGWTFNYDSHLADPGDGSGALILVSPDAGSNRYILAGNNTYTAPPGIASSLVLNPGGGYTATLADQTTWAFDQQGRLTAIADRYGNRSTLTYNASSELTGVSDPAGRGSLTLAYDTCFTGRLCSVTDWSGRVVTYGYDSQGRLHTVSDRNNQTTTYAYNGTTANVTTITDPDGHVVITNDYDAQGRVDWQKDAQGLTTGAQTTFTYGAPDGQGNVTTTVTFPSTSFDGFAATIADTFDSQNRLTKRVSQPSATETYTETYGYDANFFRNSVTDARGNTTLACYDVDYTGASIAGSRGNLTRTITPPPTSGGNPLVTLLKYDSKNNLIESVAPKGVSNGATITCSTNLSSSINTLYATDYTYDSTGAQLLTTTRKYTDPSLGQQTAITKFEYGDSANSGRVTRTIPPRGNTGGSPDYSYATTFAYYGSGSQAGLLQSATDALGNQSTYSYDSVGRKTSMVDADGNAPGATGDHTWTFAYDNEDRLASASAPAPSGSGAKLTSQQHYDAAGNRDWVQDANGQYTRYVYDVRNSLQEVDESATSSDPNSDPSKIVTKYTYDNLGNLQRVLRAAGDSSNERVADYAYDGLNRVRKEIQHPSWPSTSPALTSQYAYDGAGNRASLIDPLGQTTTFGYDPLNRLTGITYSDGQTPNVSYVFDADSNRTSMSDGTGQTTYTYDELDRPTGITSPGSQTVGYRYDLDGNRTRLIYPDNTAVTSTFNKGSQLASLADWANRSTSYTYFPDGHLKQSTNVNGTTSAFSYDNAQRLTQVLNQQGTTTLDQHAYTLDSVGNRTQLAEVLAQVGGGSISPTTTYVYDHLYRLQTDGTNNYVYDPLGNRLVWGSTNYAYDRADRITAAGSTSYTVNSDGNVVARGADSFGYDQANRLKSATVAGTTSTFVYDGDGKRTSATFGSNPVINYAYDAAHGLPILLMDGTRKYVWGANGLAYETDLTGNIQAVPLTDGLGSARALTDATGTLIETYRTDPFGVPTATQGSSTQPFGFTGEQGDPTGLLYLRARIYDPQTGRFLQRDTVPGIQTAPQSLQRFSYARSNPVLLVDPAGMSPQESSGNICDQSNPLHYFCGDMDAQSALGPFGPRIHIPRIGLDIAAAGSGSGESEGSAPGGSGPSRSTYVPDDFVVVRGGRGDLPAPGDVFSGAAGATRDEAAAGVPHGSIRVTTAGEIRAGGGTVEFKPEPTRSGVINDKHVNITLGERSSPFGDLFDNPVPKKDRIQ